MAEPVDGQVHKIIRVVSTSETSWEDAARVGVGEATKTIRDLHTARVVEADVVVTEGAIARYRIKLEMAFQLDRSRLLRDATTVEVRRYLILANQTLASPALHELVAERVAVGPCEFHVLVPEAPRPTMYHDPTMVLDHHISDVAARDRLIALKEAEDRLDSFRATFAHLGASLTGEVGLGDPMTATRRVMERSTFDEIIVSTLPTGVSRWLKMDLPARLERAFEIPVIPLIQSPDNES